MDKFKKMKLTKLESEKVKAVAIAESPVNIECKLRQVMELGSHSLFIADVVNVRVDGKYMDELGRFNLARADLIAYSHGRYYELGKELGSFGYSIMKEKKSNNKSKESLSQKKIEKTESKRKSNGNGKMKSRQKSDRS